MVRFKEHITRNVCRHSRLGKKDWLVRWSKPKPPKHVTAAYWQALPDELLLRQATHTIACRGMCTRQVTILTSLCDNRNYKTEEFADLYRRRWGVELFLKDLKVTLKMDTLRCLSPAMIRKALWMHLIAYNLIPSLIWRAASENSAPLEGISFKAAVSFIGQWLPLSAFATHSRLGNSRDSAILFCGVWPVA